jgi:bisphosphoglycerate-independent phosphoglycerate mutase (AlkP superfamily)
MGLTQLLSGWIVKDTVAQFAERVAGRSRQRTWQRIQHRINSLSTAEARGYIRARAVTVVDDEIDRLIVEEGVKAAGNRDRIQARAMEMLLESILASTHASRQTRRVSRAA